MGFIGYFVKVSRVAAVACERRLAQRWVWEAWEMEETSGEGCGSAAPSRLAAGGFSLAEMSEKRSGQTEWSEARWRTCAQSLARDEETLGWSREMRWRNPVA
jgi:hypothetical protein